MKKNTHGVFFLHVNIYAFFETMSYKSYMRTFCVHCTVGYKEFDFFLANEEHRPFDGCKIEIWDAFNKYVFWFFEPFFARLASKFQKMVIWPNKFFLGKNQKRYQKTQNFTLISNPLKKFLKNTQKKGLHNQVVKIVAPYCTVYCTRIHKSNCTKFIYKLTVHHKLQCTSFQAFCFC